MHNKLRFVLFYQKIISVSRFNTIYLIRPSGVWLNNVTKQVKKITRTMKCDRYYTVKDYWQTDGI